MMKQTTRAFVFARGGSKGIPKKNLQKVGGIHLVGHSIEIAKKINNIEKIYMSTDCPEIADISRDYGAEIIFRPQDLAADRSPEILSWKHAINYSIEKEGFFNRFLSIPPTSPLRNVCDVNNCLDALVDDIDIVFTISDSKRNPWFNMVKKDSDGLISLINQNFISNRRQDAPKCFDITTVAYAAKTEFILKSKHLLDGKVYGVPVPENRSIDIDTPFDLKLAKLIYNSLGETND
jgi:CMP-N-acetylneuraminic acid synthetase